MLLFSSFFVNMPSSYDLNSCYSLVGSSEARRNFSSLSSSGAWNRILQQSLLSFITTQRTLIGYEIPKTCSKALYISAWQAGRARFQRWNFGDPAAVQLSSTTNTCQQTCGTTGLHKCCGKRNAHRIFALARVTCHNTVESSASGLAVGNKYRND